MAFDQKTGQRNQWIKRKIELWPISSRLSGLMFGLIFFFCDPGGKFKQDLEFLKELVEVMEFYLNQLSNF